MKENMVSEFYIENGETKPVTGSGVFETIGGDAVYEVMKLVGGVPLFWEDHMDRMRRSARRTGVEIRKPDAAIEKEIAALCRANAAWSGNVKLIRDQAGAEERFMVFRIPVEPPGPDVYKQGVRVILFEGERDAPEVKTIRDSFRNRVQKRLEAHHAYEALLVDREGFITEGSRSNIFYLQGEKVLTPPDGTVLPGVTRRQVVKICRKQGIPLEKKLIRTRDLSGIDAMLITGTTVDILPVSQVGELEIASSGHPLVHEIIRRFAEEVRAYVRHFRSEGRSGFPGE